MPNDQRKVGPLSELLYEKRLRHTEAPVARPEGRRHSTRNIAFTAGFLIARTVDCGSVSAEGYEK